MGEWVKFVLVRPISSAMERVIVVLPKIATAQLASIAYVDPLELQPPLTPWIDWTDAEQADQDPAEAVPSRALARLGAKRPWSARFLVELGGGRGGSPWPRAAAGDGSGPGAGAAGDGVRRDQAVADRGGVG